MPVESANARCMGMYEVRGVGLLMRMANYAVASSGCTMPDPGGTPGLRGCRLDLGVVPVRGPACAERA